MLFLYYGTLFTEILEMFKENIYSCQFALKVPHACLYESTGNPALCSLTLLFNFSCLTQ